MKHQLLKIKWAYQRVRYGYDETLKWSFEDYFGQFIKPLKEFCEDELREEHITNGNNPKRKEIYEETLKLIGDYETEAKNDFSLQGYYKVTRNLWKYVGANIGYYWN